MNSDGTKNSSLVKYERPIPEDEVETSYLQLIGCNEESTYVMIPNRKGTIKDEYGCDETINTFDGEYEICQRLSQGQLKVKENPCYCK